MIRRRRSSFSPMNDDPIFAARAIENGAKGYIGKCEDPARFVAAIRSVAAGQTFLLPEMAQKLAFLDPAGAIS